MAKRRFIKVKSNGHDTIIVAVDAENADEILPYIFENSLEEFILISSLLFENNRIKDKYCKANVSEKANNMFEMRFTKKGINDRIYCQEKKVSKRHYIIMVELFKGKKTQGIPPKIKNRIETMGGYDYEI